MLFREGKTKISEKYLENKENWEDSIHEIMFEVERSGLLIGEGKTAHVRIIEKDNTACLKILDKAKIRLNRVDITNHVNEEIDYLDKLTDKDFLEKIGIKEKIVPEPIMSTEEKGFGFLLMEYIHGITIEQFFKKEELDKIPKNIDWNIFFNKLEDIITKLNNAGIHHRDLHTGNIMINSDGNPIIIDFGNAYKSFYSEDNPYQEETIRGIITYKSDMSYFNEIKRKIVK